MTDRDSVCPRCGAPAYPDEHCSKCFRAMATGQPLPPARPKDPMLLSIPRSTLLDALGAASMPVDSSAAQPILQSVRLTMGDGALEILGSDLLTSVVARVTVSGTPGGCCANARTLAERVKLMPDGCTVKLSLSAASKEAGSVLLIEGGQRRFSMSVRDTAEFPKGIVVREPTGNPVPVAALAVLLDRGACAMSDDRGSQAVTRVTALSTTEDGWTEVGSASMREAASSAVETGLVAFREVLVPYRGVEILRRFLSGKGEARFEVDASDATAARMLYASRETSAGRVTLGIQLAEPTIVPPTGHQYRMFYAQTEAMAARTFIVNRVAVLESITAVAAASDLHQVTIHAADGCLKVSGKAEAEDATDELACDMSKSGDVVDAILSGDSICKMIALATSEKVSIRVANPDPNSGTPMPVVVREIGELDARAWWLTMPIMPRFVETRPEAKARAEKRKSGASLEEEG